MTIARRLVGLDWVAVVMSPLTVILMEAFWVYPWFVWLGKWQEFDWQRPPLSLASIVFLIGVSFFVTRFSHSRRWPLRWIQSSIIAGALVTVFVVLRVEYGAGFQLLSGQWFAYAARIFLDSFSDPDPVMIALPAAVYLWWRGICWGQSSLYFGDVYRSLLGGLAALVVLIIVWGISLGVGSLGSLASTVGLHVAGFSLFGLMALALGHLRAIRQRILKEETAPVFSRRWLFIVVGVVGGIVLSGVGIASVFSAEFITLLGRLMTLTFDLLRQLVHYLLIPLGYLAEGLVRFAQWIIELIRTDEPYYPTANLTGLGEIPEATTTLVLPTWIIPTLKWGFFAIVAIAFTFLLVKAISRLKPFRAEVDIEEIHESLWSWRGFKADLRLFFSMLWQRLVRKRKKPVPVVTVPDWYTGKDFEGMLGIREIYRHLLWEAASSGIRRWRHETPYEYASRLGRNVPNGSEQVGELTELYIDVRYGELEVEDKKVHDANSLWKALRRLLTRPEGNQQTG